MGCKTVSMYGWRMRPCSNLCLSQGHNRVIPSTNSAYVLSLDKFAGLGFQHTREELHVRGSCFRLVTYMLVIFALKEET